jgi:hypothetical protein
VANKDIARFNSSTNKWEKSSDLSGLELSVSQLSSSVLSIAGDVDALESTVGQMSASTLPYDANTSTKQKIDNVESSIPTSASDLPYSSTQSTKQKIDEIVDSFVTLDDTGFTWDSYNKRFSRSLSLSSYKAIIVNATNGAAVMGAFYSSQNSMLYVYGFIPSSGESINDAYHFKVLIIK